MCESFRETDPEFSAFFEDFARQQAPRHCGLTEPVRFLVMLSALAACGGPELYASTLNDALDAGLTPVQAREILYHTVPYAGYARIQPCFAAANQVFRARGVALPLPAQSTTTPATRFEKGLAVQKQLFGAEQIETMRASAPADQKPIQDFLSASGSSRRTASAITTPAAGWTRASGSWSPLRFWRPWAAASPS